ncbi:helix-turn-helix domain-containing protein [Lentzea sp. E54]|uniref:helix-turn-helix domain-containing protein n=1 Tax=Lentzea xerophila TaxID=3435883 RepID=UPI003DA6658D
MAGEMHAKADILSSPDLREVLSPAEQPGHSPFRGEGTDVALPWYLRCRYRCRRGCMSLAEEVADMGSPAQWTGREARALRRALRLSVRAFAERLGVGVRTVTKWESLGARTTPRPFMQSILDTALSTGDVESRQRFELLLRQDGEAPVRDYYRSGPREWDYETWTDDLGPRGGMSRSAGLQVRGQPHRPLAEALHTAGARRARVAPARQIPRAAR